MGEYASYEEIKKFVEKEHAKKDNAYIEEDSPFYKLCKKLEEDGMRYDKKHGLTYLVHAPEKIPNIIRINETVNILEQMSGYPIETLVRLFTAGYTLVPPYYSAFNFEKLAEACEILEE